MHYGLTDPATRPIIFISDGQCGPGDAHVRTPVACNAKMVARSLDDLEVVAVAIQAGTGYGTGQRQDQAVLVHPVKLQQQVSSRLP